MPSFDEANGTVSQTPTSQMTRGQVEAEIASVLKHIERLEKICEDKPESNLIQSSSPTAILLQRILERKDRIQALEKRIETLDNWDRAVFKENVGQGSSSRNG